MTTPRQSATPRGVGADEVPLLPAEVHDLGEEGSDMTRDIFFAILKDSKERPPKTQSLPDTSEPMYQDIGKASDIAQPGGFRRDHVISNLPDADVPSYVQEPFLDTIEHHNVVESAYGDFIIASLGLGNDDYDSEDEDVNTPLVSHASKLRRKVFPSKDAQPTGASVRKTVFTILKSFIGSGILFLPKAFQNGGMLFSIIGLSVSALLSTFCMMRLTMCSKAVVSAYGYKSVSYGMLGEKSFGSVGRAAVNMSLVLSQVGFCCSYLIFVQKNIGEVILQAFNIKSSLASYSWTLIILQIPLYTPLTWVRHIEYFAITNLIADVLIFFGLLYIIQYSVHMIGEDLPESSTWENFNSQNWALFLGTAVYCFEGIGLVIPIYDAMDDSIKHKFPRILSSTILFLVTFFSVFAGIVYAAFGQNTQSVVTMNLPSAGVSGATMTVQLTYSLALVLTYPLMLYPVVKIIEGYMFPHRRVKGFWRWPKNAFRFALVCVTAAIAYFGKEQLDNFVALIGGFCSVPLAFIYPCLFHSRLVDEGHFLNGVVIVIGIFTMTFATYQAVSTWN